MKKLFRPRFSANTPGSFWNHWFGPSQSAPCDDVKALASIVLGHRLIISADARLRGANAGEVVAEALSTTPVPLAD